MMNEILQALCNFSATCVAIACEQDQGDWEGGGMG